MLTDPPIALGRTAQVYAWTPGTVLKLYLPEYPAAVAEAEFRSAAAAHASGIPTPAALELVDVAGRVGVVYERVDGPTLSSVLFAAPEKMDVVAREMAELHTTVHRVLGRAVTSQHERLGRQIARAALLSDAARAEVLRELAQLPTGEQLCHGDFHPDNILVTADGPVIIDWVDVTAGNPCADVARTALLLRYSALPAGLGAAERSYIVAHRAQFLDAYLAHYCALTGVSHAAIDAWQRVVAAARLSEGIADADENSTLSALATAR